MHFRFDLKKHKVLSERKKSENNAKRNKIDPNFRISSQKFTNSLERENISAGFKRRIFKGINFRKLIDSSHKPIFLKKAQETEKTYSKKHNSIKSSKQKRPSSVPVNTERVLI